MKAFGQDFLPSILVAACLASAVAVFISETNSFRNAVAGWAARDLGTRTKLAASTLHEPLATGDFRMIHEFGAACAADGVRLTVFSAPGGVVFDSIGDPSAEPESIYSTHPCGEYGVRLGLPMSRVLAPYRRARFGFLLAALVGGAGVLLVVLFTVRQRVRMRELARERDAQRTLVEKMKKVEEFRRDFIADISHEIKTPLTGIIGSVDLLSDASLPEEMKPKLLEMLKTESERLNALAQDILSLARLERGEASETISRASVDVSEILKDTVDRLRTKAAGNGVEISVVVPESCTAECDAQLISSAVSNLVCNAIRHSGSKDIVVSLRAIDGNVRIEVEDHGVGIPEAYREKVFERFYRVDDARSAATGGAGLGLAIVRRIARLHGGDVMLEAAKPSGCRFVISFPA